MVRPELDSFRLVWRLLHGWPALPGDPGAEGPGSDAWANQVWRVAVFELPGRVDAGLVSDLPSLLPDPSAVGPVDWNPERQSSRLTVILQGRLEERLARTTLLRGRALFEDLKHRGLPIVGGVGSVVSRLDDLPRSLNEARLVMTYGWVQGTGLYTYDAAHEAAGQSCTDLDPYPMRFATLLSRGGDEAPLIAEYVELLGRTATAARRLAQEIQNVFTQVADLIPPTPELDWSYHAVDFIHGPEDLTRLLTRLCSDASRAVLQRGDGLADRKAREFRDFVEVHAEDGSLCLTAAANALQISASYLAKILKGRLAVTFVDYVTQRRLERAQQLLVGSDLMTSVIAERVGFASTHYFSSRFKKKVGLTPSEYRLQSRLQNQARVMISV